MTLANYSPYFHTVHDETEGYGSLGRGTHYSVLQCAEFRDVTGAPVDIAHDHKFAVIWDEDHDERVITVIERLYAHGLLSPVQFIGERKAFLSVIIASKFFWLQEDIKEYSRAVEQLAKNVDMDTFSVEVSFYDREHPIGQKFYDHDGMIICSREEEYIYLQNIDNLWKLGTKEYASRHVEPAAHVNTQMPQVQPQPPMPERF